MAKLLHMSKVFMGREMKIRMVSAAASGDISTVRKLLRKNVNPNILDDNGYTALTNACAGGYLDIVRLLLECGADPNFTVGSHVSPLHLASKGNHTEIVKLLLLNGASNEAETKSTVRPIDFSKYYSNSWDVMRQTQNGVEPVLADEIRDTPIIPTYAIPKVDSKTKVKKGKKGKKGGKKGKKGKKKKK